MMRNITSSLHTGDQFKNKNGVVITIGDQSRDGRFHFSPGLGEEVSLATESVIYRILMENGYQKIIDSSCITSASTVTKIPKKERMQQNIVTRFSEFDEVANWKEPITLANNIFYDTVDYVTEDVDWLSNGTCENEDEFLSIFVRKGSKCYLPKGAKLTRVERNSGYVYYEIENTGIQVGILEELIENERW